MTSARFSLAPGSANANIRSTPGFYPGEITGKDYPGISQIDLCHILTAA